MAASARLAAMGEHRLDARGRGLAALQLSRPEDEGLGDVIEKLKAIQKIAFSGSNTFRVAVTCGSESVLTNEAALQKFLSSLPKTQPPSRNIPAPNFSRNTKTFFPLPYQVYYGALSLPTVILHRFRLPSRFDEKTNCRPASSHVGLSFQR